MNLQEWRAKRQVQNAMTLPSGLDVTVKAVSIQDLVVQGKVPDTLFATIDDLTGKAQAGELNAGLKTSELATMGQLIVVICRSAIVEPAELDVEELPFDDQLAVFEWVNRGAAQLATFPQKRPANSVVTAPNGRRLRSKTK
jgi:hypothetical protein